MIRFTFLAFLALCSLCYVDAYRDVLYGRCFKVLDLSPADSITTVKARYRQLALIYHPDKISPQMRNSGRSMQDINEAYDCALQYFSSDSKTEMSELGTIVYGKGLMMWRSLPEAQRNEFSKLWDEYYSSKEVYGDFFLVLSEFWSRDAGAVAIGWLLMFLLKVCCVLCAIGMLSVTYIMFKILWWWIKLLMWIARCVSAAYRYIFVSHKAKVD